MKPRCKFLKLCGLGPRNYAEPKTSDELLELGQYYSDAFDRAAELGDPQLERVREELSRALADFLQPPARERFGIADAAAVRTLWDQAWDEEAQEQWGRQLALMKEALSRTSLTTDQKSWLFQQMEDFPDIVADSIATEAACLKAVPIENVSEISLVLAEMIEEEKSHDNES